MGAPAGKEDPVEFDSSLTLCNGMTGVAQVGGCFEPHWPRRRLPPVLRPAAICSRSPGHRPTMKYHYLHSRFTHRVAWERRPPALHVVLEPAPPPAKRGGAAAPPLRAPRAVAGCDRATLVDTGASGHRSDGEFGWGGMPVTAQRRRPEAPLRWNRNLPRRSRPKALLTRRPPVQVQSVQAWPCDPLAKRMGSGY